MQKGEREPGKEGTNGSSPSSLKKKVTTNDSKKEKFDESSREI